MNKRIDIAAILSNPSLRRDLLVPCIVAIQAREGITTTLEQAQRAYDKVLLEKAFAASSSGVKRVMRPRTKRLWY